MRAVISSFFVSLLFYSNVVWGQNLCFSNNNGEVLAIQDSVAFIKIRNFDGFDSFSVYYGRCVLVKSSTCRARRKLVMESNVIEHVISQVHWGEQETSVGTLIEVKWSDGTPVEYATVSIFGHENELLQHCSTNKNGIIQLSEVVAKGCKSITIRGLGISLVVDIQPRVRNKYTIRCLLPYPFIAMHKGSLSIIKRETTISVNYNGLTHVLERDNDFLPFQILPFEYE